MTKAEGKWKVAYTQSAIRFIGDNVESERIARKIFAYRELLESFPDLGHAYDPIYPAAKPPFPCRALSVPDTPFTLYYLKDEDAHRIIIFCVDFQRADPNACFSTMDWTAISW